MDGMVFFNQQKHRRTQEFDPRSEAAGNVLDQ